MDEARQLQWLLLSLLKLHPKSDLQALPDWPLISTVLGRLGRELTDPDRVNGLERQLPALQQAQLPQGILRRAEQCLQWGRGDDCTLLCLGDEHYPPLLKQIPDPPYVLFVRGDPAVLARPQLAIVGSRKPSPYGIRLARRFAAELSIAGYTVTSGLARGIDGASHEGALQAGKPTIAVLGSGVARIYPRVHQRLAQDIVAQGALVSEYPPDTNSRKDHFPQRNRIISGLSHGVLVVEAAESSGSLITAGLAGQQGREVFAIPGPILNSVSRGCHKLIRQGATLVESCEDILQELTAFVQWEALVLPGCVASISDAAGTGEPEGIDNRLLAQITYNPVSADELCEQLGLDIAELSPRLMLLELNGMIACKAGCYSRT